MLTLLGIIAFAGMNAAALADPRSHWHSAYLMAWMLTVGIIAVCAMDRVNDARSTLARAAIIFGGIYLSLPWMIQNDFEDVRLPHAMLERAIINVQSQRLSESEFTARYELEVASGDASWNEPTPLYINSPLKSVARLTAALAFGLFGGALAFWMHNKVARRPENNG